MKQKFHVPLVFAHRGFHSVVPENTVSAFVCAAEMGFDGIETDVQIDRTGTPILFHDYVLQDGRAVKTLSREELSAAVGYQVPFLAQALDAVADMIWDVEIKNLSAVAPTIKILRNFVGQHEIFVSSFIHAAVRQVVESLPIRGALLVAHCPDGAPLLAANTIHGIDTVVWDCDTVDMAALDWAADMGLRNIVYGYRPGPDHAAILEANIEAVITDYSEPLHRNGEKSQRSRVS